MEEQGRQLSFQELLDIMSRRRWLILGCVIVIGVAGIFLAMAKPDVYSSKTVFLVKDPTYVSQLYGASLVSIPFQRRLATIQEDVRAFSNIRTVVEDLNLAKGGKSVDQVAREILDELEVEVLTSTRGDTTVVLSYTDVSPSDAANVANQIREQYVSSLVNGYLETVKRVFDQDKETLEGIQTAQQTRLESLRILENQHLFDIASAKPKTQTEAERIDREMRQVTGRIEKQQKILETAAERIKGMSQVDEKKETIENALWVKVNQRVEKLRKDVNELADKYTEKHKPLQVARADLAKAEEALAEQERFEVKRTKLGVAKSYVEATDKIRSTRQQLASLQVMKDRLNLEKIENQRAANELPQVLKKHAELNTAIASGQAVLAQTNAAFHRSKKNWENARESAQLYFEVVDEARVPRNPSGPNRPLWMIGAVVLGLGIGIGFSVLLYFMARSISSVSEAKTLLDIPVMGTVQTIQSNLELERGRRRRSMAVVFSLLVIFSGAAFALVYTQFPELLPGFVRDSITAFRDQIR